MGNSVPLYLWQLILAFQFGKGVSIGAGIISGLISALMLTGLGDYVWKYVFVCWTGRVPYTYLQSVLGETSVGEWLSFIPGCLIFTGISMVYYFLVGKPLGRKQNIGIESRETMAKILAVDDEPAILEMIESILNKDGHLVTKVSNPLKINMEELHRYDLILLDIMMPGIDGFELCKRIRALVDCPILFLTAKTEENSLVNGLSLGADDYISKPFG